MPKPQLPILDGEFLVVGGGGEVGKQYEESDFNRTIEIRDWEQKPVGRETNGARRHIEVSSCGGA